MVKVALVLNLNMSNYPASIFSEDLVGVIGIERTFPARSKMNSAINHVTIHQFGMEFGMSSFEFPGFINSVYLSSSY